MVPVFTFRITRYSPFRSGFLFTFRITRYAPSVLPGIHFPLCVESGRRVLNTNTCIHATEANKNDKIFIEKVFNLPTYIIINTRPHPVPAFLVFTVNRDQCLGKIEVPLSSVKGMAEPKDMVLGLSAAEGAMEPAVGDLRVTVLLK